MIDTLWSIAGAGSWIFLGYSAHYVIRAFKLRTRHVVPYKEVMTDEPHEMHRMIERLSIDNRMMRGKIENLNRDLESARARRKPYIDAEGNIHPEIAVLADDETPEGGKLVLVRDKVGYMLRFHGEIVWKKGFPDA